MEALAKHREIEPSSRTNSDLGGALRIDISKNASRNEAAARVHTFKNNLLKGRRDGLASQVLALQTETMKMHH